MADNEELIKDLKVILDIDSTDSSSDDLLNLVVKRTKQRLLAKIKKGPDETVPNQLEYILFEVSVRRFNRLNNEGMKSYSEDGENVTFNEDDFTGFENEISNYLSDQNESQMPTARFLNPYEFSVKQ
jgi:hypothetical protein